jgi:hypothetical protein
MRIDLHQSTEDHAGEHLKLAKEAEFPAVDCSGAGTLTAFLFEEWCVRGVVR